MQPKGSDMAPVSWRALTSSRLASIKDYVAQKDYKATYDALSSRVRGNRDDGESRQSWDQWARGTLGKPYGSSVDAQRMSLGVEKVQLFPGWAVRRYKDPTKIDEEGAEFSLEVYVSGFASSLRPPEAATRSQKAFYRIAKGYAALPKLEFPNVSGELPRAQSANAASQRFNVPSDLDLSSLPPTPAEITDETELAALEAHLRRVSTSSSSSLSSEDDEYETLASRRGHASASPYEEDTPRVRMTSRSNSYGFSSNTERVYPKSVPSTSTSFPLQESPPARDQPSPPLPERMVDYTAQKLHANLDARLKPFWSSAVPNRVIRLSIFCPRGGRAPSEAQDSMEGQATDREPVTTENVVTTAQGAFQTTFNIPWERLATHPPTLHIAFGDRDVEYPVVVEAEMWAPPPTPSSPSSSSGSVPYLPYKRSPASRSQPDLSSSSSSSSPSASLPQIHVPNSRSPSIKSQITVPLSIPRVPLRLISDIDDTIKHAGVLMGAKHVFRNVFVRHLDELIVHSMVDWYRSLWQRGVRFHYVSNSPFELLPVLNEFFHVSSLPQGSIKLKSYAARSLLPALLSPPAARKRQGVVEVLDAFPQSRFVLVGDTGEQDLELYVELARERPNQIVAVFLRDVTTPPGQELQPGSGALDSQYAAPLVDTEPRPLDPMPSWDSLSSMASSTPTSSRPPPLSSHRPHASTSTPSPVTPTASTPRVPGALPRRRSSAGMTPEERRVYELQLRTERARVEIPRQVAFRVFREPEECVELNNVLDRLLY